MIRLDHSNLQTDARVMTIYSIYTTETVDEALDWPVIWWHIAASRVPFYIVFVRGAKLAYFRHSQMAEMKMLVHSICNVSLSSLVRQLRPRSEGI